MSLGLSCDADQILLSEETLHHAKMLCKYFHLHVATQVENKFNLCDCVATEKDEFSKGTFD